MFRMLLLAIALLLTVPTGMATNFPGAQAHILNECPHVELSDFSFKNAYDDRRRDYRFQQNLSWKNVGKADLIAFEIVLVKYDAFNRHMRSSRWSVTGKNSADWNPLKPGESSSDGTIGYGMEEVYTGFAYVSAARLSDGTVWRADSTKIQAKIKAALPGLREVGDIEGKRDEPAKGR